MKQLKFKSRFKHILGDMHTPVSLYGKLRDMYPNALLLESADYHDRTDSKSFICLSPIAAFQAKGLKYTLTYPHESARCFEAAHPKDIMQRFKDFVRSFESNINSPPQPLVVSGDILRLNR